MPYLDKEVPTKEPQYLLFKWCQNWHQLSNHSISLIDLIKVFILKNFLNGFQNDKNKINRKYDHRKLIK